MLVGSVGQVTIWMLLFAAGCSLVIHTIAILTHRQAWRAMSRIAMGVQLTFATLASISFIWLLVTENLSYAYVADYTAAGLPLMYRIAAFWAGNAGSLLLWTEVITFYGTAVVVAKHEDSDRMLPIVSFILTVIILFFAIILAFNSDPFTKLPFPARMGNGLSPLLQNPGMTVHPVNIYLGYVGFSIPFAYAMASLILRKNDGTWLKATRRWTLVSWLFLSVGIVYGAHWSYEELGWGGYWAWDPVENASLFPWLTATAFLHSAIVQEKFGMFKRWNFILISLTFWLTMFGAFLTRSGVIWSIHAFSNASLGTYFIIFLVVTIIFSISVIGWRWSTLQADRSIAATLSKESGFALNNVLFIGITFAVMWGTVYPIVSQVVAGQQMTVSTGFYNSVGLPIAVGVIALMGVGPLIRWREDTWGKLGRRLIVPLCISVLGGIILTAILTAHYGRFSRFGTIAILVASFAAMTALAGFLRLGKTRVLVAPKNETLLLWKRFWNQRRRYGGYIIHFAIALMAIGITGSGLYHIDISKQLAPGQSVRIGEYRLTYEGTGVHSSGETRSLYANLVVGRGDTEVGVMQPAVTFYLDGQAPSTNVSVYSRPLADLYVAMLGVAGKNEAIFDVHLNPLVQWIWVGGYLFILGALVSLWPQSVRKGFQYAGDDGV